ncbi:hypothetical protein [Methylibium sp.]|uniref:hypothetical protein n=1 Tax=Methylibium sp. TaxID=2067992 RepID=UPI003D11ADFF
MSTEQAQRAAVATEVLSWLGTPYHHHARIKGVGSDCAQILCAVFEAVGRVGHIDLGNYPRDWHLHRSEELYEQLLEQHGARRLPEGVAPQVGDIATFKFGRTYSHGGIFVDGETLVHAYVNASVTLTRLSEAPLAGRPAHFWTLW